VFLKSLTLRGFKSFAETSTLEFEPGVTVVVGPNGSGKSNIVDAVAWVLGAQGPRMLRSGKMEDVIFAGTSKRPALGRAEVSLTIDNSAGLLPIEFTEVRVTRAMWRSGDSEYSINGVPCRLLDVQDLLSDSGVGRQQHTIISQSQLDAILSARPEDRRAVIEEAAGISKHRRRKEKAERRLEATEGALVRAQDLLREVRRQLRPLERQAGAARRHADLTAELVGLRRYLFGRELDVLSSRMSAAASSKAQFASDEEAALQLLSRLDADVLNAEGALDAQRRAAETADVAELVSVAEGLRARASGLVALLHERGRRVEREREAAVDHDVVASLEAEAAELADQLGATEREVAELLPLEAEVTAAEKSLARETAEVEAAYAGAGSGAGTGGAHGASPPAAQRAGELRAELDALRRGRQRLAEELGNLDDRAATVDARQLRLSLEADQAAEALRGAQTTRASLVQALRDAEEVGAATEQELARSEQRRRAAEALLHAWGARADTLAEALDEARARAGARRLAEVDGVIGALLELVDVDDGFEGAFEAAAGGALSAVLMAGEGVARKAVAHLARQGASGAVIPLDIFPQAAHRDVPPGVPERCSWLRPLVRSQDQSVGALLDVLLMRAVVVDGGWSEAVEASLSCPELVVVTRSGDRCAGGIWRLGANAGGAGVTGAALEHAIGERAEARAGVEEAVLAETSAKASLEKARSGLAEQRRLLAETEAVLRGASSSLERARAEMVEAGSEASALRRQRDELIRRGTLDDARVDKLEARLPALEAEATEEGRRAQLERSARGRLAERASAVATLRRDLEVRATAIEERRGLLVERLAQVERRLEGKRSERELAAEHRSALEATARAVRALASHVERRLVQVEQALGELKERRRAEADELRHAGQALEVLRRERSVAERQLSLTREQLSRSELDEAQLQARLEALTENVRRELDCEPGSLAGSECPELPPGTSAPNRARELERDLRLMGPVNPLALEEYAALEERHKFLEDQLHDVMSARRELTKVIRAVDGEIISVFKAAFDDVAENFTKLVATLFPGGSGALSLDDPANLLESGVELEVRPVGKNVRRLSLLSGGERSLVALAFLFAVFRSRPSPFYMMDEVESALDDVNLHRFLDLVHEFRDEAQLLIVSHQKRTMEAADCLYGVSMPPGGSSMVVSQRIDLSGRPAVPGERVAESAEVDITGHQGATLGSPDVVRLPSIT